MLFRSHWTNIPYFQGEIHLKLENYEQAYSAYSLALERASDVGMKRAQAYIRGELGVIEIKRGNLTQAYDLLTDVLPIAEQHHDARCLAFCHSHLAKVEKLRDNLEEAHQHAKQAEQLFEKLGMQEQANRMRRFLPA